MEAPKLASDLALRTRMKRGELEMTASASNFSATGAPEGVNLIRFREGLRLAKWNQPEKKIDIHYSQVGSVEFEGQSANREQRSVVGRAIVGKYVAGDTGAVVGALSGLQDKVTTSREFAISYWDPVRQSWKQHTLSSTDENFGHFMECVAEELDAYRRGEDPESIPDPSGRSEFDRRLERGFNKFMGYAIAGVVGIAVLWWVLGGVAHMVSNWWSTPSRQAPEVSSGPVPTYEQQLAAQQRGSTDSATTTASSVTPIAAVPSSAPAAVPIDPATPAAAVVESEPIPTAPAVDGNREAAQIQPSAPEPARAPRIEEPVDPSFDCSRATTLAETSICASPALAKLDRSLNDAYTVARQGRDPARVQEDQKIWLRERARCKDDQCLADLYRIRIAQLASYKR